MDRPIRIPLQPQISRKEHHQQKKSHRKTRPNHRNHTRNNNQSPPDRRRPTQERNSNTILRHPSSSHNTSPKSRASNPQQKTLHKNTRTANLHTQKSQIHTTPQPQPTKRTTPTTLESLTQRTELERNPQIKHRRPRQTQRKLLKTTNLPTPQTHHHRTSLIPLVHQEPHRIPRRALQAP